MEEERIALYMDYENLAIGARENLGGMTFQYKPIGDALAELGRVVVRRAYADWSYFDEDRRMLTRNHVELIEIPQRMGTSRKNSADIKLCVDALEMAFERDYLTTFVICTGDSDFTPLVHKLRELNKRVIGVGIKDSTSALLPPACDLFLFYDTLEGVDVPEPTPSRPRRKAPAFSIPERESEPEPAVAATPGVDELAVLIAQTVAGIQQTSTGEVLASSVKRALLRKDPTFSEATYGFRAFGELLRHLADQGFVELIEGPAKGDPEVALPRRTGGEDAAFELLQQVVKDLQDRSGPPPLSGLKDQLRKVQPDFSEKKFGFRGFLQFCRAAETRGLISLAYDNDAEDYFVTAS